MDMLNYHSKQRHQLSSVRFVTHKGNSMKLSTITKHGQRALKVPSQSTMDHFSTRSVSKTTKFIKSRPVVTFKGEPPF